MSTPLDPATSRHGVRSNPREATSQELPERWKVGTPFRFSVPKPAKDPWEECRELVEDYDIDMCRAWKDEIDKVLIFASLFSAAVTTFTAGSYQWLEDPTDTNTTLLLLAQLVQLHNNTSITLSSNARTELIPPFKPTQSAIRINIAWFLSLTLSLGTVLIGVLCLQWLREFRRRTAGPLQDRLARRQMAFDGLGAWRVPEIISSLSLILELAVILFFIGVIDLLWMRHPTVAIVVVIPIGLLLLFVLITTAIPAVELVLGEHCGDRPPCPYRSPQALLACHATIIFCKALELVIPNIPSLDSDPTEWDRDHRWSWDKLYYQSSSYPTYLVKLIQWVQRNFGFTTERVYNLYHCLTELDDHELTKFSTVSYPPSADRAVLREFTYLLFLHASVGSGTKTFDPFIDEHYIRVLNSDPSIARPWVKEHNYTPADIKGLEPSMQEEFINQRLLCALTLFEQNPLAHRDTSINIWKELRYPTKHLHRFSPQTDNLLQQILCEIKQWLLKARPNPSSLASGSTHALSSLNTTTFLMPLSTPPPSPNPGSPLLAQFHSHSANPSLNDLRRSSSSNQSRARSTDGYQFAKRRRDGLGDLNHRTRVRLCAYGLQSLMTIINSLPLCTLKARYADLAWTVKDEALLITDQEYTRGCPELALEAVLVKQPVTPDGRRHSRTSSRSGEATTSPGTDAGPTITFSLADGRGGSFYKEDEWLRLFDVASMSDPGPRPNEGLDLGELRDEPEAATTREEEFKELWFMEHLKNLPRTMDKGKQRDLGSEAGDGVELEEGVEEFLYTAPTLVNTHSRSTTTTS